ncbi:MAG: sulfite exporter TauE/SafE family protein [Pseudomonadota bacterium]
MSGVVAEFLTQFPPATLALIVVLSLVTSVLHGATGVAGGFLLAASLAPIIGVKPLIPVMAVTLLISHSARALLNWKDIDRKAVTAICVTALPLAAGTALIYGRMNAPLIALVLGLVVISSIPARRWASARKLKSGPKSLMGIGSVYGALSGIAVGPGMLLIPFMLGTGMDRRAFVASLAAIAMGTNTMRIGVFGMDGLFDPTLVTLGVLCGIVSIPGNYFGRSVLRAISNERHAIVVDWLTVLGAVNFFWLAWRAW